MVNQIGREHRARLHNAQRMEGYSSDLAEVEILFRMVNWQSITVGFGVSVYAEAHSHLAALLNELITERGIADRIESLIVVGRDCFRVRLSLRYSEGQDCDVESLSAALCTAAALRPFVYLGHSIHIALSYRQERGLGAASTPACGASQVCKGAPVGHSLPDHVDARRHRDDMAKGSQLLARMEAGQLELAWQAVCATSDSWEVLYYEALLRQVHREPTTSAPSDAIEALERLGLARVLDAHVVTKVLDQLEADSSIFLGANISARSATLDHWWLEIERRLKGRPDLARRLIIEITETAEISPAHAVAFVDHMRGLGCRIALDDFGTGFASIRQLLVLSPDIVKIPSFFVRRAPMSKRGEQIFMHIIGLARALSPLVVVEGVETEEQCKLTESAGAPWLQGYRSGRPTMGRPWVQQPDSHKMWALLRFRDADAARSAERAAV